MYDKEKQCKDERWDKSTLKKIRNKEGRSVVLTE